MSTTEHEATVAQNATPTPTERFVYFFGDGRAEGSGGMKDALGGKGAGLAEMTNAGVPVPPGFTITTSVCRHYHAHGRHLPEGFAAQQDAALARLEAALGRKLSWTADDVTLQNIQARVRAPSIWMLANVRGAVLLTTSNRSEAAVGYATMDGDTAGGLAPLGGIDKTYLRSWLAWMETTGPVGAAPVPALALINAQQPTAELRPSGPDGLAQTDEADLMPYDLLEAVEDSAIRDKHTPVEVLQELLPRYPERTPLQLATWIERFFRLWCRNQWKRERIAPSFHLDDRNVDPRSWCRFPILSGGFERELAELRAYVAAGKADRP
jgi:NAD+ synthase (glutamine-hydrolysing)